jgi:deazaflavin-dependent oxidoreductase (nitroreductase family)
VSEAGYWAKYNAPVFDEARKNNGKSRRGEVIILHTIGARSGREHVIPLNFAQDGDRYIVVASKGGAARNPAWYHNLVAHPDIDVEIAGEIRPMRARVTEGAEREEMFAKMLARHKFYAGFQKKTKRIIPVVVLDPPRTA